MIFFHFYRAGQTQAKPRQRAGAVSPFFLRPASSGSVHTSSGATHRLPAAGQWLCWGLILLLGAGLVQFRPQTAAAAADGLTLCARVLAPALFPFFVLSGLAVETGLAARAGQLLERPMTRLFHLPGVCGAVFVLGAVGGYPTGARAAVQLYRQGLCSRRDAERMLGFCNNCGPAFLLGVAGGTVLGSTQAGLLLWGIHLAAAVLAGLLWREASGAVPAQTQRRSAPPVPLHKALVSAVSSAVSALLGVCGFVLFFSVLLCLLGESGILGLLGLPFTLLGQDSAFSAACAGGLLEISCGVTALCTSTAGTAAKAAAASFLLGFGGCSVMFQSIQQAEGTGLSFASALVQKLTQAVLAGIGTFFLFRWLPDTAAVFAAAAPQAAATVSLWLPAAWLAGIQCLFSLFSTIFPCQGGKRTL